MPATWKKLEVYKAAFEDLAPKYGLKKEHLGAKFKDALGQEYEIVGLFPRSMYPIVVKQTFDGKTILNQMTLEEAKKRLST